VNLDETLCAEVLCKIEITKSELTFE